jgi:hypothetical protein
MTTESLISVHLHLECIAINGREDLVPIPCPNPDAVPRLYVAQHSDDGNFSRFVRHDLPESIRQALLAIPPDRALHDHDAVRKVLAADGPCDDLHYGQSCVCPDTYTRSDYPDVVQLTEEHRALIADYDATLAPSAGAVFAVILDGRIVSTCQSSREDESAAEAWVRTLPTERGRGFARQVTAAWASHIWLDHKLPFYSYRMDNLASRGVACSLGLEPFITDAAYS